MILSKKRRFTSFRLERCSRLYVHCCTYTVELYFSMSPSHPWHPQIYGDFRLCDRRGNPADANIVAFLKLIFYPEWVISRQTNKRNSVFIRLHSRVGWFLNQGWAISVVMHILIKKNFCRCLSLLLTWYPMAVSAL